MIKLRLRSEDYHLSRRTAVVMGIVQSTTCGAISYIIANREHRLTSYMEE